jgi:hypothetical protein
MKILLRLLLLAALAVAGWWCYTTFFPPPQQAIRRNLGKVAKLASFAAGEGNISRIASVQKLGLYFADDVDVAVDFPGHEAYTFRHRAELMQAAMAARGAATSVEAKLYDIVVTIGADGETAKADLTAMATVGGEKAPMVQRLRFSFKKINGSWLITRVELLPMPGE